MVTVVAVSFAAFAHAFAQSPPTVYPSPRLAAVDYAISHGFEIPRTNVSCPERRCFASTKAHALLVDDLKDDDTGIYIKLYSPGTGADDRGTLVQAIVNTAKAPGGWTATGFTRVPQRILLR